MKPGSLTCALLLVLVSLNVNAAPPASGETFKNEDASLSFWAPSKPKKTVNVSEGKAGNHRRTLYAISGSTYLILASVVEVSGPPTTGDEDYFLEGMVDDLRKGIGPGLVLDAQDGKTNLKFDPGGLKGLQLLGTLGDLRFRAREYVGKCRLYIFQITHAVGDKAAEQLGDRFFKSIAIADPVPKTCTVGADAQL